MYVDLVEEIGVDRRLGALDKAAATEGEDFAHGVLARDDTVLVGIGCPNGVVLDNFNDDHILGNALEEMGEVLVETAFLPNTPQHPRISEHGKIRTNAVFVLCLGTALGVVARRHPADILLNTDISLIPGAPFAAEVEVLRAVPFKPEEREMKAASHVTEASCSNALASVARTAVGEQVH